MALHRSGKAEDAGKLYDKHIPTLIDAINTDVENQTGGGKQLDRMVMVLEDNLSILAEQAKKLPQQAPALTAKSFMMADLARGSGVQRALTASAARANIRDPKLAELARKEQDTQRRIGSLEQILSNLMSAPPEDQLPAIQAKMKIDIASFKAEREKFKKDIEQRFPDYANLVNPKPATIEKTSKLLKDDEVLVSWYFAENEGFVWAITKSGAPQFHRINLGRDKMAEIVAKLRKSLDAGVATVDDIPAFDVALSTTLYKTILEPVQSALQGKKVMLTVPHAELGQLPLALLTKKPDVQPAKAKGGDFTEYRKTSWLIRDIAVAQLPSVTALAALRNLPKPSSDRRAFAGFGDPYFSVEQAKIAANMAARANNAMTTRGIPLNLRNAPKTAGVSSAELALLPRLPDTMEEIQEIGKVLSADPSQDIFLNRDASVAKVMEMDLSNRKVVMFATHGLIPGELDGLTQPALALSAPSVTGEVKGDGLLTMEKILTLKLNADWVVLSACNTASGEGVGAEAVSGLGSAFFYAGARALLVSNWPVDSEASRILMTDMFKRQQEKQGLSKAEYLRESIINMIDTVGALDAKGKTKYSYAHPLFWAPFVVVGD
jgi:CHAT domain-containing protein